MSRAKASGGWNYRLTKMREGDEDVFAIREVYYDAEGNVNGWTENPVYPQGSSWVEFLNDMTRYHNGALRKKSEVLDLDEIERGLAARPATRKKGRAAK